MRENSVTHGVKKIWKLLELVAVDKHGSTKMLLKRHKPIVHFTTLMDLRTCQPTKTQRVSKWFIQPL